MISNASTRSRPISNSSLVEPIPNSPLYVPQFAQMNNIRFANGNANNINSNGNPSMAPMSHVDDAEKKENSESSVSGSNHLRENSTLHSLSSSNRSKKGVDTYGLVFSRSQSAESSPRKCGLRIKEFMAPNVKFWRSLFF